MLGQTLRRTHEVSGTPGRTTLQTVVMAFAILYWLSPVDAMPFLPFDDIAMMIAGYLFYTKNDAGNVEGGAE